MGIIMAYTPDLITYADSNQSEWQEFRPGSRRKVLYEDSQTGQVAMLVQWDPGYRMGVLEHHERDEHLYILAGTFVDEQRASGPGSYILNRAGSQAPSLYTRWMHLSRNCDWTGLANVP
jgi:ChrR-like protein with cupin domain